MNQIGIIVNPHAKSVRRSGKDLPAIFRGIGGELADVRLTGALEEIDRVAADFKAKNIAYLGIAGGDGTIHHVLTGMINAYAPAPVPPIVILKSGTMDNIARTIDLKGKGPGILRRLVNAMHGGRPVETHERSTMRVGDRYCFLFGAGLTTNFLDAVYEGEKGFKKNVQVICRAIADGISDRKDSALFKRLNAEVTVDGRKLPFREISAILSGTVEKIGMGFTPLPRASERPDAFHLIVSGIRPGEAVTQIIRIKKGEPLKGERNFNGLASTVAIASDGEFRYTMDGDLFTAAAGVTVTMGPRVRLVYV